MRPSERGVHYGLAVGKSRPAVRWGGPTPYRRLIPRNTSRRPVLRSPELCDLRRRAKRRSESGHRAHPDREDIRRNRSDAPWFDQPRCTWLRVARGGGQASGSACYETAAYGGGSAGGHSSRHGCFDRRRTGNRGGCICQHRPNSRCSRGCGGILGETSSDIPRPITRSEHRKLSVV